MKTHPTISIIMPMYGVEKYIAKAINSVLNQTFKDWELLIVNDGSPDGSREIASCIASCDSRIKILDKENGGLSDARNYGLRNACGEYVHFFDSDDWIESNFYSELISCVDNYDLVISGYKVDNEKSCIERNLYLGDLNDIAVDSLYSLVGGYLNYAWNKIFKRSFLLKESLFYEKGLYRIEDSEFMSRFLGCHPKVRFIKNSGYHYMCRNTSTLSNIFDERIFEHLKRSISIHSCIYRILSNDSLTIETELGLLSYNATKSVIYKTFENLSVYKIKNLKFLLDEIVCEDVVEYLAHFMPHSFLDRFALKAILKKRWLILYMMSKFNKVKKSVV